MSAYSVAERMGLEEREYQLTRELEAIEDVQRALWDRLQRSGRPRTRCNAATGSAGGATLDGGDGEDEYRDAWRELRERGAVRRAMRAELATVRAELAGELPAAASWHVEPEPVAVPIASAVAAPVEASPVLTAPSPAVPRYRPPRPRVRSRRPRFAAYRAAATAPAAPVALAPVEPEPVAPVMVPAAGPRLAMRGPQGSRTWRGAVRVARAWWATVARFDEWLQRDASARIVSAQG